MTRASATGAASHRWWSLLVLMVLVIAACSSLPAEKKNLGPFPIETLAMIPVQNMAAIYGGSRSVRNPLSGSVFVTGTVSDDAARFFEDTVYARIQALGRFRVLPPESTVGAMSSLTVTGSSPILDRNLWVESGRALNVDGVLVCFLYRYHERVGTRYAAASPASVAFDLYLLRTQDGRVLWQGRFDETQRALSENLMDFDKFIKRKGWISANDLALAGLDDLFDTLRNPPPASGTGKNDP